MKQTILCAILLLSSGSYSQELELWMTQSNYDKLSKEMKLTIEGQVKFLDENLQLENEKNGSITLKSTEENEQIVKNWLAENAHVKIVKRSEFNEASHAQREIYSTNGTMVLIGEQITYEDIINYK